MNKDFFFSIVLKTLVSIKNYELDLHNEKLVFIDHQRNSFLHEFILRSLMSYLRLSSPNSSETEVRRRNTIFEEIISD
jgi:hypothetical protein